METILLNIKVLWCRILIKTLFKCYETTDFSCALGISLWSNTMLSRPLKGHFQLKLIYDSMEIKAKTFCTRCDGFTKLSSHFSEITALRGRCYVAKLADKGKNWHISICQLFGVAFFESTWEKIGTLSFVTSKTWAMYRSLISWALRVMHGQSNKRQRYWAEFPG